MDKDWIKLIFGLEKRYSILILLLLQSRKELSFDQIYDFCSQYKGGTPRQTSALREHGRPYRAISRESISRATAELQKKKYIRKKAKLNEKGRPYAVYALTEETRKMMERHVR